MVQATSCTFKQSNNVSLDTLCACMSARIFVEHTHAHTHAHTHVHITPHTCVGPTRAIRCGQTKIAHTHARTPTHTHTHTHTHAHTHAWAYNLHSPTHVNEYRAYTPHHTCVGLDAFQTDKQELFIKKYCTHARTHARTQRRQQK